MSSLAGSAVGGDPVELLCGLLCDDTVWRPVADRLADRGVATSIRSFAGISSITAMARRVLGDAPRRFAVAGHSMGARVALEAYRLAPERISRLALLNTGIHPAKPDEPATRARLVELGRSEGMAAVAREWLPPMMGRGLDDEGLMQRLYAMVERQTVESLEAQVRALLDRPEAASVLGSVRVPILLVAATRDRWSPIAQHEDMRAIAPAARLTVVSDAGHMAPAEAPEQIATALASWLTAE